MKKELDQHSMITEKKNKALLDRALKRKELLERSYEPQQDPGEDEALEKLSRRKVLIYDPIDRIIVAEARAYVVKYERPFYDEFRRLSGIVGDKKPKIFGHYTNLIVYKRYPPGTLMRLKKLNPKDENGRRKYYYHQFLSEYAEIQLITIIDESITMMQGYTELQAFLHDYCKMFNIPYQSTLLYTPQIEFDQRNS